jgi:hypothetical protein
MNKVTRLGVFETNSSSSHSLSIDGSNEGPGYDEYVELNDVAARLAQALRDALRCLEGRQNEVPRDARAALIAYQAVRAKQVDDEEERL